MLGRSTWVLICFTLGFINVPNVTVQLFLECDMGFLEVATNLRGRVLGVRLKHCSQIISIIASPYIQRLSYEGFRVFFPVGSEPLLACSSLRFEVVLSDVFSTHNTIHTTRIMLSELPAAPEIVVFASDGLPEQFHVTLRCETFSASLVQIAVESPCQ